MHETGLTPSDHCDICNDRDDKPGDDVLICKRCGHPDRVRTLCLRCGRRLDLSLQQARELFSKAGLTIPSPGFILRFKACVGCEDDEHPVLPPDIFSIDRMEIAQEADA